MLDSRTESSDETAEEWGASERSIGVGRSAPAGKGSEIEREK